MRHNARMPPRHPSSPASAAPVEHFFAPCPRGLEVALADELSASAVAQVQPKEGGVAFSGPFESCYRVNLESRIASRVLWLVTHVAYRHEEDVYERVRAIDWRRYFDVGNTIRVNVAATGSPLKSLDFITLRIKDAICDRFRTDCGRRPSVDTKTADVRIHAYFDAHTLSLYLDTSGEPLFKRGLRAFSTQAPLRENLAAGILRLAGWSPDLALLDPMCGGGTFLLEAAEIALARAPGARRSFAFQKLCNFDAAVWDSMRAAARGRERPIAPRPIYGSDLYGEVLKDARRNLEHAGLESVVTLKQANILELSPPAPHGLLITNPPYGVRLGEQSELAAFYPRLGNALKQRFAGWRACIFTADMRLPKLIGLKPRRRTPLYNGALECRLYEFDLVAGVMRRQKAEHEGDAAGID
jgi:putative N6-adenine-specific DNA methylase